MQMSDEASRDLVRLSASDALIVVDMQYDFLPAGALAIPEGDDILPGINSLMETFAQAGLVIVLTQDWHPQGHHSFASAHEGKAPFDAYEAEGIGPVLWPDHCVPGTQGADFHRDLRSDLAQAIVRKGYHLNIDSYSAFLENDRRTETGLDGYLKSRDVQRIFVCGLALDYCVYFTSLDGIGKGYQVFAVKDLSRPVGSPKGSEETALHEMNKKGVHIILAGSVTL